MKNIKRQDSLLDRVKKTLTDNPIIVFVIIILIVVSGFSDLLANLEVINKLFKKKTNLEFITNTEYKSPETFFGDPNDEICDYLLTIDNIKSNIKILDSNNLTSELSCTFIEKLDRDCSTQETKIEDHNYKSDVSISWFKNDSLKIHYIPDRDNNQQCNLIFKGIKNNNNISGRYTWIRKDTSKILFFDIAVPVAISE